MSHLVQIEKLQEDSSDRVIRQWLTIWYISTYLHHCSQEIIMLHCKCCKYRNVFLSFLENLKANWILGMNGLWALVAQRNRKSRMFRCALWLLKQATYERCLIFSIWDVVLIYRPLGCLVFFPLWFKKMSFLWNKCSLIFLKSTLLFCMIEKDVELKLGALLQSHSIMNTFWYLLIAVRSLN